jgi:pimeloyl-ACP methyl ester carboxylesterase
VVLVHGAYADGSCWADVIPLLQAQGLNVASVQNPLRTLEEDVEFAKRTLALMDGPLVLVGHSYSGMIVTEAGVDPKVSALVYVAARAPDAGEDYTALASRFPTPPASAGPIKAADGYAQLSDRLEGEGGLRPHSRGHRGVTSAPPKMLRPAIASAKAEDGFNEDDK